LDGVATVDGLTGGTTYYFWVELIDPRGKTVGPQSIGSYTTPMVWEFHATVPSEQSRYLYTGIELVRRGFLLYTRFGRHIGTVWK
jgi:hypothetical protein